MRYEPGDVVYVDWPYKEDGIIHVKSRPALIVDYNGDKERVFLKFTSQDKSRFKNMLFIEAESPMGAAFGLTKDSYLDLNQEVTIRAVYIKRLIGRCLEDDFDEILDKMKKARK